MRNALLALTCLTLFATSAAQAQTCNHSAKPHYRRNWVRTQSYHAPQRHHASTVAGSYGRARADVVRAWGHYNLLTSQARINLEEASRRNTENQVLRTQAYFDKKTINRSYRYGNSAARPPRTIVASHAKPIEGDATLAILLPDGRIAWPTALTLPAMAAPRSLLQQVVLTQPDLRAALESNQPALAQATNEMTCLLREHIHQLAPQDYVDAKLFLKALNRLAGV